MDARIPLSPRASAFSIASLVAAEATERTARLGPESSDLVKLRQLLGFPAGMHFSTVTRDMEGEPLCCVYADLSACQKLPSPCCGGTQAKRVGRVRAKSRWRELWQGEFQASNLDSSWQMGRVGILPKAVPPPAWGPSAEIHTQLDTGPEEGEWRLGGQERRTTERQWRWPRVRRDGRKGEKRESGNMEKEREETVGAEGGKRD